MDNRNSLYSDRYRHALLNMLTESFGLSTSDTPAVADGANNGKRSTQSAKNHP